MIRTILHIVWRLLILFTGIIIGWLALFKIRPLADAYLPTYAVWIILWCSFAYGIIPTLIRIFRWLIKPDHIPLYVSTTDGWPSDPVNLVIIANNKAHLRKAMKQSGWYEADKLTLRSGFREVMTMLFNTPYPNAPVGTLMLFNRKQDIAFQIPTNPKMSPRTRHHVRFWKLKQPPTEHSDHQHFSFWFSQLKKFTHVERSIWIGAATEDVRPVDVRWRSGQLTHGVSHDDTKERDFLIETLKEAGLTKRIHSTASGQEFRFRGQSFRTVYVTDGSLRVVELKRTN